MARLGRWVGRGLGVVMVGLGGGELLGCQGETFGLGGVPAPQDVPPPEVVAPVATPAGKEVATPTAEVVAPDPSPWFQEGINLAQSAVVVGQTAQSAEDWRLAASRWQQAIAALERVPPTDPNHGTAQERLMAYRQNLAQVEGRAAGVGSGVVVAPPEPGRPGRVAEIPILERRGGTPVVMITLMGPRGQRNLPILFDTGATLTLIPQDTAAALGMEIVSQGTATVADGRQVTLPMGFVDIAVGGLVKTNVLVAIGGDMALLGQDIYGEYGLVMGRNTIELFN